MEVWKNGSMEVPLQLTFQTNTSTLPYFHTVSANPMPFFQVVRYQNLRYL